MPINNQNSLRKSAPTSKQQQKPVTSINNAPSKLKKIMKQSSPIPPPKQKIPSSPHDKNSISALVDNENDHQKQEICNKSPAPKAASLTNKKAAYTTTFALM